MPGSSSELVPVASSSSSRSAANPQTSTAETMELKRKVEMLTEELSRNRAKLAKRTRAATTTSSRGQMVIEIPDFPIGFYRVADQARPNTVPGISLQQWFENFCRIPSVQKQPRAYHDWIQSRTVELFPKVLNVIGNHLGKREVRKDDLLSCRLVSKSWKQAVDQFLQNSVSLEPTICVANKLINVSTCIPSTSSNYQSVVEMLGSLERNKLSGILTPFPSGHLVISNRFKDNKNPYHLAFDNVLETLLEFHGGSLQSFTYLDFRPKPGFFSMTRWLKKMPNLKALQIIISFNSSKRTNSHIPVNFPVLPKLITFVGTSIPARLTELVLTANPQIRNLSVNSSQIPWSKLNQLSLRSLSIDGISVAQFSSLAALEFPLEKLKLTGLSNGIDLGEVSHLLQTYEGTLKELYLTLGVTDNLNNLNLKLPRLKHLFLLSLNSDPLQKSYDFLLSLESLESLDIGWMTRETQREADVSQVIQMVGYFERLYESNVWKLFPRLKKIKIMGEFGKDYSIRSLTYTRDKLPDRSSENTF